VKEQELRKFVKAYYAAHLSDEVWHLISNARFDLWHGPMPVDANENWPGFQAACREIKEALRVVSDLYLDDQAETLQENEPYCCDGNCDGADHCDMPLMDDYTKLSREEVIELLVSKELKEFVL
jgi:hypothetical protein